MIRDVILQTLAAVVIAAAGAVTEVPHDAPQDTQHHGIYTGDSAEPFYHDPVDLRDTSPGDVLRTLPDGRVLYASTNRVGDTIAVSGRLIRPAVPWNGGILAVGPGTHGLADECAPSRQPINEYAEILAMGTAIIVTDYEGLGTPGTHTYMDRLSQGHAVLDSVRAAENLLGAPGAVVLTGYSQGGAAVASAAELASDYAPELDIRMAFIGAPPADLTQLPQVLDGGPYFLFQIYALAGLAESYGMDLEPLLTDHGQAVVNQAVESCVARTFDFRGGTFADLSREGRGIEELVTAEPYASMLADQRIGHSAPEMPVVITHSPDDDVIPFHVGQNLAREWQEQGADVQFLPLDARSHGAGYGPHVRVLVDMVMAEIRDALPW